MSRAPSVALARIRHGVLIAGLSAACILPAGCRKRPTVAQESAGPPRLLKVEELTEAERRYGRAARRSDKVTYQPDAGRVLGVRKEGDGLQVVLGPVEITEVVRDGEAALYLESPSLQYKLNTVFTSTGSLRPRVFYELRGGLGVEYRDGKWGMGGPTGVKPVISLDNLLMSTQGSTYGVTGMVMTHHIALLHSSIACKQGPWRWESAPAWAT